MEDAVSMGFRKDPLRRRYHMPAARLHDDIEVSTLSQLPRDLERKCMNHTMEDYQLVHIWSMSFATEWTVSLVLPDVNVSVIYTQGCNY